MNIHNTLLRVSACCLSRFVCYSGVQSDAVYYSVLQYDGDDCLYYNI